MNTRENRHQLAILGSTELVDVAGIKNIPAKIDTGADSSSIWASHVRVAKDGTLYFRLFNEGSPFYTGKTFRHRNYQVAIVRSSSGHEQIRYRTYLELTLKGRRIKALFFLSDRSRNNFPILIGRRTIAKKFLVDVSKNHAPMPARKNKTRMIQKHLKEDPYKFHQEYIKKYAADPTNIKPKKSGA